MNGNKRGSVSTDRQNEVSKTYIIFALERKIVDFLNLAGRPAKLTNQSARTKREINEEFFLTTLRPYLTSLSSLNSNYL